MTPTQQAWNVIGWTFLTIGILVVVVTLARMWFLADATKMDDRMREAGHVPPETDVERTDWIAVIRPNSEVARDSADLTYGRHSAGWMLNGSPHRGQHRKRWFTLPTQRASVLLARLAVPA